MAEKNTALAFPADEDKRFGLVEAQDSKLAGAAHLATEVAKIIKSNGLSRRFGNAQKDHVYVEGWATIARVNNEQPHSSVIRTFKAGEHEVIEAKGWLTDTSGQTVSEAMAYVSTEEKNWAGKPFYARASMAQTRAVAKAMRLRHSWVMVMAGYEATPAEEIEPLVVPEYREKKAAPPPQVPTESVPISSSHTAPEAETQAAPEPLTIDATSSEKEDAKSFFRHEKTPPDAETACVTIVAYGREPKVVGNGSKTYSLKVEFADGTQTWASTFHEEEYDNGRLLKGKQAIFTYKWNGKWCNFYQVDPAAA